LAFRYTRAVGVFGTKYSVGMDRSVDLIDGTQEMFALNAAPRFCRPRLRQQTAAFPRGWRFTWWMAVCVAVGSLTATEHALAIGLGSVSGQAVLGQPLHIEIPLLGTSGERPAAECFRVRPPQVATEPGYALKSARIEVVGKGGARLVVTTAAPVREPVIEFGITVACGFDLTKDYLLLSSPPARVPATCMSRPD
jgi:hypothetical protein